jgi:hypothetical protein
MCPHVYIVKQGESMAQRSLGVKYGNGTEKRRKRKKHKWKMECKISKYSKKGE